MNLEKLFPLIDVENVRTETDTNVVNSLLRDGWSLLMAYPVSDGGGGFYGVYALGKRRPMADRTLTDRDQREYDQRLG